GFGELGAAVGLEVEHGGRGQGEAAGVVNHRRVRADADGDDVGEDVGSVCRSRVDKGADAVEVLPGRTSQDGVGVGEAELVAGQAGGDGREGGKTRAGGALDVVTVVGHGRPGPGQHDPVGGDVVRRQDGRRQQRVGLDLAGEGRIAGLVGGGDLVEI